jgi:hypothetical protein
MPSSRRCLDITKRVIGGIIMVKKDNNLWIGLAVVAVLVIGFLALRGGSDEAAAPAMDYDEPVEVVDEPAADMAADTGDDMAEGPVAYADYEGCSDSDGGLNYDVAGTVTEQNHEEVDTCSKSRIYQGRLYEEYCDENGENAQMIYECPSGVCVDGACA